MKWFFFHSMHAILLNHWTRKINEEKNITHFVVVLVAALSAVVVDLAKKNGFCSIANLLHDFSFHAQVLQIIVWDDNTHYIIF